MAEAVLVRRSNGRQHVRGRAVLASGAIALGLVALGSSGRRAPLLIYNASASAPLGFYRVFPARPLARGDLVLARAPETPRRLAAERGYLPAGVALVKRIAALSGERICAIGRAVTIDGIAVATRLPVDRAGRPLPAWGGCRTLGPDEVFLLMAGVPDSFDSRYFGPVSTESVIGRLVPL
jgi:conjugative transfer signal peptidase TraF